MEDLIDVFKLITFQYWNDVDSNLAGGRFTSIILWVIILFIFCPMVLSIVLCIYDLKTKWYGDFTPKSVGIELGDKDIVSALVDESLLTNMDNVEIMTVTEFIETVFPGNNPKTK